MIELRRTERDRSVPHNGDAEAALLGAMLLDRDVIADVGETLGADDFYVPAHRGVYLAVSALDKKGTVIDVVTVKDELRRQGSFEEIGGGETLVRLMEAVPSAAGAKHHARIVRDCAKLRALIHAAQESIENCYQLAGEADELIDQAEQRVFEIRRGEIEEARSVADLVKLTLKDLDERAKHAGTLRGLDTGFTDLNELLNGLQKGNLVIVAARPSMGKTSFAMNIGLNSALKAGRPVLVFSIEMPKEQIAENMLCSVARVDAHRMRKGELTGEEWGRLTDAAHQLAGATILIDDTPAITAMALRAKARRVKAQYPDLGLIIVDYMQLMSYPDAESRQHEITMISQSLKTTARQLEVPVMALSQLNRAVDAREDHTPRMSDLRESGSIEQDADVIIFLYRASYYKQVAAGQDREAEIIVAKHRNGPVGTVKMLFLNEYLRFVDPARAWQEPPAGM